MNNMSDMCQNENDMSDVCLKMTQEWESGWQGGREQWWPMAVEWWIHRSVVHYSTVLLLYLFKVLYNEKANTKHKKTTENLIIWNQCLEENPVDNNGFYVLRSTLSLMLLAQKIISMSSLIKCIQKWFRIKLEMWRHLKNTLKNFSCILFPNAWKW